MEKLKNGRDLDVILAESLYSLAVRSNEGLNLQFLRFYLGKKGINIYDKEQYIGYLISKKGLVRIDNTLYADFVK